MILMEGLHKSFGENHVFTGLDLVVEKGETHVVIGRSGEGKSVLLRHLSGLMRPDSGGIHICGRDVVNDRKTLKWIRHNVSMVFQMAALFDSLTVYENVSFFWLENGGKTRRELDLLVAELLDEVNLPHTENLMPSELSGGMRKRVGLARALATQPQIILYDEPTTGLDPVTSEVINELMVKTSRRHQLTSVVITHDMKSAYAVGDRISMLYEGKIIATGTADEIRFSSDPVVCQFVNGLARGPITHGEDEQVQTRCSKSSDRVAVGY